MAKLSMFTIHPMLAMAGRTHAHTHTQRERLVFGFATARIGYMDPI